MFEDLHDFLEENCKMLSVMYKFSSEKHDVRVFVSDTLVTSFTRYGSRKIEYFKNLCRLLCQSQEYMYSKFIYNMKLTVCKISPTFV